MRKLLMIALLLTACSALLGAQTTHTVTLTWTDPDAGATFNVYRATGLCSGSPAFSKIASAVTVKTYQDASVTPGNYCYYVTAALNGAESAPSVSAPAAVLPFAPGGITVAVQ